MNALSRNTIGLFGALVGLFAFQITLAQEAEQSAIDHSKMDHSQMNHSQTNSAQIKIDDATHDSHSHAANTPVAGEEQSSAQQHIAPDPPQLTMGEMSVQAMKDMMQMDDTRRFGKVLAEQFEWRSGSDTFAWSAQAWYGGDYNKVWFKTEGDRTRDTTEDASADLLWDRNVARWWSVQSGVRYDFGEGPSRTWAAIGVQGLAPYWFHVEATLYGSDEGRAALRLKTDYDLRLTQRWIVQPEAELNAYAKEDRERNIGSGLSDSEVSLRVRYEIRRELAPYVGVTWLKRFGATADLIRAAGENSDDVRFIAGLRFWF